jgi:hypothetical protein
MGRYNSSLTRVQPVFSALLSVDSTGAAWLSRLWQMATARRLSSAAPSCSHLLTGGTFERAVPPSAAFLRWAIQNPERLTPLRAPEYGATGAEAQVKRAALFGTDAAERHRAQTDGLGALERLGAIGSARQWWAFEGFTHVDATLETRDCLLFIEGKRTETVSASTRWFRQRNQLWRNVEVAGEIAAGRQFGVLLAVEDNASGDTALAVAERVRDASYPHLSDERRRELDAHLLGYVVWSDLVDTFGLSPAVLKDACD